ncbi:TPR domain protein, putative component of TonB system [Candidatus Sumerlaea chitinivorans]|uniref:TPR domain protein, putative component of TonB system n=1 Tax=Sumerlaea chitinivorans TaxID=2250252 RepID=A0A2Z4Y9Z8_SUMC1|nr:TPR domain protein, putative component of TonB system [Candidatus Sumerlaea chitinivorans]
MSEQQIRARAGHPVSAAQRRRVVAKRPTGLLEAEDLFSFPWLFLFATYTVMALIFLLFTPYTHQLDEIKNALLMTLPPFLLWLAVYRINFETITWRKHASSILLGGFVLAMVISFLLNPYKLVGERVLWFQFACITFTVVFAWCLDSEPKVRTTVTFYMLLSFASVAIGLFLFAGRGFTDAIYEAMKSSRFWSPQAKNLVLTLASSKEMYSTILNSDFFAAYLVMTIPLVLSCFFVAERTWERALALTTFLLMNVCLIFTNSNDSYMSMALVAYPLYFLLGFKHLREINISKRVLAVFFIGSAVLAATVVLFMIPKLSQTWDFKAAALEGRKILWLGGFYPWLYRDDPTMSHLDWIAILFGTGPGGYRFYFPVFRRADFFDNQINNVTTFGHNYYLDILLEFGLLGLGFFLAFYGRVLWDGIRQVLRTENRVLRFYQMGCVSGLAGVAVQNFFSPNNRWAVCGMIFWSLFGLSMGIYRLEKDEQKPINPAGVPPKPSRFYLKLAALALCTAFVLRSVPQGLNYFPGAMAHGMGLIYMEAADYRSEEKSYYLQRARDYFLKSIELNPTFVSSYYKLGHVYNQLGEVDKSLATYERLHAINPHYSEVHLNIGILYGVKAMDAVGVEKAELLEKSYRELKEAARQELKPNVQWTAASIGKSLAETYDELHSAELSKEEKEKLAKLDPEKKRANEVREEIKQFYRNILTYQPKLEEYQVERKRWYNAAQRELVALAYQTGKLDEAEEMLKQMYNEDPDRAEYRSQLLAFYDRQGKKQEKIAFLEEASHNAPTDISIRRTLADAYREAGMTEKYVAELRKIEILDPKNPYALTNLYRHYAASKDESKVEEYRKKLEEIGVDASRLPKPEDLASTGTENQLLDTEQALLKTEEKRTQPAEATATRVQPSISVTTVTADASAATSAGDTTHSPSQGATVTSAAGDNMTSR